MSRLARHASFIGHEGIGGAVLIVMSVLACSNASDDPAGEATGAGGMRAASSGGAGGAAAGSVMSTPSGGRAMGSQSAGHGGGGEPRAGRNGRGSSGAGPSRGGLSAGGEGGGDDEGGAAGSAEAGTPTLFWLDVMGKVLRSTVTPFNMRTLVPSAGQGPDGIAVDLEAGHVYWTNMGNTAEDDGTIQRSNLDGTDVTTVVPVGGTYTPKQLKLERVTRKLYWSDREGMQVQRSNLDGTELETLYTAGSGAQDRRDLSKHCVGIAVDVARGFFYWSQKGPDNGHVGSLRRAHLVLPAGENSESRSDVEILYDGLPEPIDIDLDLEHGLIYWTDRGDDTVNRGPIEIPEGSTAAERSDREVLVSGIREAIGLALDHARGLVYYTSAVGDVGRVRLDGSDPEPLLSDGGAFTGITIIDIP